MRSHLQARMEARCPRRARCAAAAAAAPPPPPPFARAPRLAPACPLAAPPRRRQRALPCRASGAAALAAAADPRGADDAGGAGAGAGAPPEYDLSDVVRWALNLPWQAISSWAAIAVAASQLRDFFGIAMGTFVISFIGNSFVRWADRAPALRARLSPQARRRALVAVFYTAIVLLFATFGVLIIPDVMREGADFVHRLQTENVWVVVLEKMRKGLGEGVMDQLERFLVFASATEAAAGGGAAAVQELWQLDALGAGARTQYLGAALSRLLRQYTNAAATLTTDLLAFTSRFALQLGVSLVLSFVTVWDLPRISRGVQSLRTSRVAPIYNTVAPSLEVFATLFGKALQAQARIAVANTVLTAAGMWALAIPGTGLLSLFVFVCGFIPIAGVIISTVPIGFVALTEYGFMKLALVILMITGVHFVEAYALNPAIYSAHLKLHPLVVLAVLVVAEHSLGVWGLLLAVPATVFALDYCIYYPSFSVTDVAAKELESVTLRSGEYDGGAGARAAEAAARQGRGGGGGGAPA